MTSVTTKDSSTDCFQFFSVNPKELIGKPLLFTTIKEPTTRTISTKRLTTYLNSHILL